MKKEAKSLKKGDKIMLTNQEFLVEEVEISDIGKHGKRKVRLVALNGKKEKMVVIRPEDYPIEVI
jgi:translation elongation factor P/translation initiation factor 5A